jgi:hypothetical protein
LPFKKGVRKKTKEKLMTSFENFRENMDSGIVRLTSINVQNKILKNPVFKSTFFPPDVY